MPHPFRPSPGMHARPPAGRAVPEDSAGLLPILTSALCSRTVRGSGTWHVLSLGCITNNGLTYVPLINTSADKLASHTSILVWGRLISGAHTQLRAHVSLVLFIAGATAGAVEGPGNYQKSDGLFHPPPRIQTVTFASVETPASCEVPHPATRPPGLQARAGPASPHLGCRRSQTGRVECG